MLMDSGGRSKDISKRRRPQEKAGIVVEFFATSISAAKLCRKHNV